MTETTRRERLRAETEREILHQARALLVGGGREAVTLRAIARELGITAPALYRYYDSREDLLQRMCDDICGDLAAELSADLATMSAQDTIGQVFAVCRGFRHWALAHPQEFALVFGSPDLVTTSCADGEANRATHDPFGRIFLTVAGRVLATHRIEPPADSAVPRQLHTDLVTFRDSLIAAMAEQGIAIPTDVLSLGTVFFMLQFWVRLYGHVALEVFGCFPFAVSDPEPLFDSMLADLAAEVGLVSGN
ncbi:TetR/AcrR family transcriptional regulator [Solihabitans fulvus]|uniref:TetR/AcrR family transcriptional regulator n=1 Tax=Solihabitans fulvus TaxID=1892852 RepID=A0A5B2WKA5_9PSEU|nr:TetR/AcrR family transcriptional regulator [Solihabitans fulvus]KAA2251348.1 TetR/AcrR family transcriptional regulator [Solihabitans fulvus]